MWMAADPVVPVESVGTAFANYGALGLFALASLAFYLLVYRSQERRIDEANVRGDKSTAEANARADRIAAEKDSLTKDLMKDVIPVLTKAVEVMGENVELQRRERR